MLTKIISGGQTGADQGALFAAKKLSLATGGWMPKDFRTDEGSGEAIGNCFGLLQHSDKTYLGRTWTNVFYADATLIFGNTMSPGCIATLRFANELRKSTYIVKWPEETYVEDDFQFRYWLQNTNISVLNVAGNRERLNKGIFEATKQFLIRNLTLC